MKKYKIILFIFLISIFIISISYAQDNIKDIINAKYKEHKDICPVIKSAINEGLNIKDVVKTSIKLGHDACYVIKCAVGANANLEQILTGAIEAGTTSDVCARCAIDSGADPIAVAKILETGLGYSPPMAAVLGTIEITLPGGTPAGGVISPASF